MHLPVDEKIAKRLWCPFARVWGEQGESGGNRTVDGHPSPGSLCLTDRCMAWSEVHNGEAVRRGYCLLMAGGR